MLDVVELLLEGFLAKKPFILCVSCLVVEDDDGVQCVWDCSDNNKKRRLVVVFQQHKQKSALFSLDNNDR